MKILILAHARSGSTTFAKWLSKELNYKLFLEPHNKKSGEPIIDGDDYIVKELYSHLTLDNINSDKFISRFDVVIGLYRENVKDVLFSMLHANKTNRYHSHYILTTEEIIEYEKSISSEDYVPIINESEKIKEKSNIVLVYEKIYKTKEDVEKLKNFLKFDEFKHLDILDEKNRYRKINFTLI